MSRAFGDLSPRNFHETLFNCLPGVLEFAPFHTPVVTIRAFDRDSTSAYTKVFYAITATNFSRKDEETKKTPRVFLIGSETGTVYTNLESYVEYRNGYFSMTVTATGANGKNATAKLVVSHMASYWCPIYPNWHKQKMVATSDYYEAF